MNISRGKLLESAAILSFGIVFVGYSVVYLSRFNPIIPITLPIGFSHVILISLILMAIPSAFVFFWKLRKVEGVFLFWVCFAILYAAVAISLGAPSHSIVTQVLGYSQAIGLWLIFRNLRLDNQRVVFVALAALIICGLAVLSVPEEITIPTAELVSYHTTALILFVTGFILASNLRMHYSLITCIVTLSTLYINGARTEFYLFGLIAPILVMKRFGTLSFLVGGVFLVLGIVVAFLNLDFLLQIGSESRILGLLELSSDKSHFVRSVILGSALQTLSEHPILGDYASYQQGFYSHNLLSAWVDFGLFGLCVYLTFIFLIVRSAFTLFAMDTKKNLPILMLTAALVLSIILSKAYFHPLIGAVVGIISMGYRNSDRKEAQ